MNRPTVVIDSLGDRTTTAYDKAGNVTTVTDASGTTTYTYDALEQQTATTNALGQTTTTVLDADGNVAASIDALGNVSVNGINAVGQTVIMKDPQGAVTQTLTDSNGNTVESIDANGNVTSSVYNALGQQTVSFDALGNATTTTYDKAGNVSTVTDPLGNVTSYVYDADNRATEVTTGVGTAAQASTFTGYDKAGNVTTETDARGYVTTTLYDAQNRVTVTIDQLGDRTTTTYDNAGNVSTVTDGVGNVTSYGYDTNNRQTSVTTAVGTAAQATTYSAYDALGNVTTQTDALGHVTSMLYDAQNRVTVVIDPLGDRTTTTYDGNGNVSTVTDGLGHVTSYAYDSNNRQTAATVAVGTSAQATTRTGYDANGNVTTVTDPVGNVTTTSYDADARPTVTINSLGARTTTAYDGKGNVTDVTDADGRQVQTRYDSQGRETGATWLASGGTTVNLQTFTYDADGDTLTAADGNGTVTYTYDHADRVASYTNVFGLTLTYSYDGDSNVTLRQDGLGGTLTSTYDAANRLETRAFSGTDSAGAAVRLDFGYTADNQLATITHATNLSGTMVAETTEEGYDNAGRVTALTDLNGSGTTLAYYNYGYDKASRVTTQSYSSAVGTVSYSGTVAYGYDAANELTSDGTSTYAFDANGNRTSVVTGGVTATYSTGSNNELTSDGTYTYTYDNAGNNTGKVAASGDTWAYTYDNANHLLTAIEKSDGVHVNFAVTYTYDAQGSRVQQDEWAGVSVATTRFNVDPLNGGNVWADTSSSNAVLVRYVYGYQPDQILSRTVASGANAGEWFYNVDNLGSVRDLVNASGVVEDHLDYTGFGVVTESNPSVGSRFGYTGAQYDSYTGLDEDGRREDDVAIGRWTAPDPLGLAAGDSDIYRYVRNDATNMTDLTGLMAVPAALQPQSLVGAPPAPQAQSLVAAPPAPPALFGPQPILVALAAPWVKMTSITISDRKGDQVLGSPVQLGIVVAGNACASYGFDVKVNATVSAGYSIKQAVAAGTASVQQYIFSLIYIGNWDPAKSLGGWLVDSGHPIGGNTRVFQADCAAARQDFLDNNLGHTPDTPINNALFANGVTLNIAHGPTWLQYDDPSGYATYLKGVKVPVNTAAPPVAGCLGIMAYYLGIKVDALGTDGVMKTATFSRSIGFVEAANAKRWKVDHTARYPALPATWT